jgi:hypothetical protein
MIVLDILIIEEAVVSVNPAVGIQVHVQMGIFNLAG